LASLAYLVAIISSAATITYCSSATFLSAVIIIIISSVSLDAYSSKGALAVNSISILATSSLAIISLSRPFLRRYTSNLDFYCFSFNIDLNESNYSKKLFGVT
jgi:hypothetical protein